MADAPLISTIIALTLIPIAFLFVHAYLSGRNKWRFHKTTGFIAMAWDLSMSLGYMSLRALGIAVERSSLEMTGPIVAYFIIHGLIAVVVIAFEIGVLSTGLYQWRKKKKSVLHTKLTRILFVIWWFGFITGEIFYIILYVI
jgi:uncharacterized membrane protein YozB (DUF420 family)